MDATEGSPGAGLPRPSEFDFMFTDEGWALLSEERRRSIIGVLDQDREEKTRLPQRRQARMDCRKALPDHTRPDKQIHPSKSLDTNLSRDIRDSDDLLWIRQHRVLNHSDFALPPMRYTSCQLLGTDALIILTQCCNSLNGGYLSLSYPARGISAMGCLIEIDIRIKGKDVDKDLSIIDGSVKAFGQFDSRTANHVDNINGKIILKTHVVRKGVEATIDLDFVEVPTGGFNVRMRDFMEKKREALSFVSSKHGNEQLTYRFSNGALVLVKVFWSTIVDGWPLGL
ncbi:hypothetical protein CFC21_049881 [Triticum aestivum]|uniref:DUF6598 domain-containing protein n=2 Tax=Triticum aestivum TaxID=4565 RepID=A0A9R1G4C2_WHEAT|nr:hypothetical protein CFC21_049881 [Triticum aestivum]